MKRAKRSVFRLMGAAGAAAVLAVVGCASTPKQEPTQAQDTGSEFEEGIVAQEEVGEVVAVSALRTVYFDFDRYNIRTDAQPQLKDNATAIQQHSDWGEIVIEGNCDERGSQEYNLALGERRANSVKQYLVDLGIPSSRLSTVSFGETKPAVMGHDESAWRWNRRADFGKAR